MSQDDILQSTKSVIQGLDALKNEHGKMLENIVDSMNISSQTDTNKLEEKVGLLRKSMDMIELGKFNLFNKRNSNNSYFIF
jgi:kinesin light chain